MTKKERLRFIEQLIEENEIGTQEELTDLLNKHKLNVSQATVSRDINELNLIKGEGKIKKFKYIKANTQVAEISPKILSLFKQTTLSFVQANNLVVIKTLSGNGSSVGMAIDEMHFPQVIGSVAGDDTVLVITKTNNDAEVLIKTLKAL